MVLLDPKPGALRPAATDGPAIDSVAEDRAAGTPENLREDLIHLLGEPKVLHKLSDLVRYASDASPYRFVPQVVVIAKTVDDVAAGSPLTGLSGCPSSPAIPVNLRCNSTLTPPGPADQLHHHTARKVRTR